MDNGKGIDEEHRARVFEPFFTTKSAGRGTGLGLSVCLRVIKYHGGDILVESQLGNWTRFTVVLPGR
jgi:signal transduction histidine kinase